MHQNINRKEKTGSGRYSDDSWKRYAFFVEKESGVRLTVAGTGKSEPFASMNYEEELRVKRRSLSLFMADAGLDADLADIIASPKPRHYRSTTKRRARFVSNRFLLSVDESSCDTSESLLEPEIHSGIYDRLSQLLNENINRPVARCLNFIIIRGSYTEQALIFNVSRIAADIVKGCAMIAERLRQSFTGISSAFIYHDPSGSKYYFESIQPADGLRMKRLFGHANLAIRAGGMLYTFHPAGFSQVNLSMADCMLKEAGRLLSPPAEAEVVDLYCGYGFFSCSFAGSVASITGIDYDRNSIEHARNNMKRLRPEGRYRFISAAVEHQILATTLTTGRRREYILLDPPRRGTQPGVIETLAERKPEKVLHIFCGVETLPAEVRRWTECGYRLQKISVLDMFPGTANLEVMVLFS